MIQARYAHFTTGTVVIAQKSYALLVTVNVNTAAAGATVTIYNGQNAQGEVVAVVDAGTLGSKGYFVQCNNGITAVVAGGTPDITVGFY